MSQQPMSQHGKPTVIVGVDESLAGLAALRYAVNEARRRGVPLRAVRVNVANVSSLGYASAWPEHDRDEAVALIARAFDKAMFGMPDDLEVQLVVVDGIVTTQLIAQAGQETDLLVLGAARRRRFGLPWFGEDLRCVRRAPCPVVIVPAPALARDHGERAHMRKLLREAHRLMDAA